MTLRKLSAVIPAVLLLAGPAVAQTPAATEPDATPAAAEAVPPAADEAATNAAPVEAPVEAPSAATPAPTAPAASDAPVADASAGGIVTASGTIPAPPEGKGLIVFYRSAFVGLAIPCSVNENNTLVNRLPYGRYFTTAVEPGKHTYMVKSESHDFLPMEVEEGETYYVKCTISMGIMVGRPNLSPADKAAFEKDAKKLKLEPAPPATTAAPESAAPAKS